jgi:hypothetical protein
MRRALIHIAIALLTFASGVFADSAAYRALDYFIPDASLPEIRRKVVRQPVTILNCKNTRRKYKGKWYLVGCE